MSRWNFSKPLLLFFLPICCPSLHCWDPTDPPALARKMETRKCAIFNTILFSTCLAQLTHSFCPESLWVFPIPTCCDLFLLKMRKSTFFFNLYGQESACNAGDPGWIPGLGRSPGGGHGNPLQYSCLENAMDGGAWRATVHGVTKSQTQLSDSHTDGWLTALR